MNLKDFDYSLPKELVAQVPLNQRDESRLMIVNRETSDICLKRFKQISDYFSKGDVLVINDTRVFPARLFGKKNTGGKVELLLVKRFNEPDSHDVLFSSLYKSSKPLKAGQEIYFNDDLKGEVDALLDDGHVKIRFTAKRDFFGILDEIGLVPLPPYIRRDDRRMNEFDRSHYQTVYAQNTGAVAAPTAGFHFTDELISRIRGLGVKIARVTLHVGPGTFLPVRTENVLEHKMHEEFFSISDECVEQVTKAKKEGNRVIAVGTTSMRALESAFDEEEKLKRKEGGTRLFIYPGYKFKIVDALITNFHLPKSTLLMLVYAFGGADLIKRAYKAAVEESFRFFSYGDAMYIM
jgi:S-adenosylmethionine:tRNA ribosyltransferase-isomerase